MTLIDDFDERDSGTRRLWTPWRMQYIGGGTKETGCIFCNRLAADDDVTNLILWRARTCFVIMNLFPYNTGHVMVVPNAHVDSPEKLDDASLREMATLLPAVLRAARRVLDCHGFNIGLNVGSIAGAGVAEHMHQHIVPRWNGDANFMPIIGSAMVIPELIPVTYAKLRAELARELNGVSTAAAVLLDPAAQAIARFGDRFSTSFDLHPGEPVWLTGVRIAGPGAALAGWAGLPRADSADGIALTLAANPADGGDRRWSPTAEALHASDAAERPLIERALGQLAPRLA